MVGPKGLGTLSNADDMLSDILTDDDEKREAVDPDTQLDNGEVSEQVRNVFGFDYVEILEDLERVKINPDALQAAVSRINRIIPLFMDVFKITDVNELSSTNPAPMKAIKYYKKLYWNVFLAELVRMLFQDYNFGKYKVNRTEFMNLIVKKVAIPVLLSPKDTLPELNFDEIEEDFNNILIERLHKLAVRQLEDEE